MEIKVIATAEELDRTFLKDISSNLVVSGENLLQQTPRREESVS